LGQFADSYRKAPYFGDAADLLAEGLRFRDRTISDLNIRLTRLICTYLGIAGIATPTRISAEFSVSGRKTERLIALLREAGASTYLSGPSARQYIDESLFRENGIRLEYKSYDYPPYPQLWGEFSGTVSVLDLIANMGPASRDRLSSQSPNVVAVG
jgi:hypothetical protein